ncbi:CLUMA_CG008725, isoform A [Clunio marinus]|uniref:CLUMA_CG008725, isoform A n=1 Tax=Clunio marinus TaxID=568069 RepID=A0A1J1I6Q8_9DIPT|nr:CLUMA_CG008725, isoform A [Clunio marinus]
MPQLKATKFIINTAPLDFDGVAKSIASLLKEKKACAAYLLARTNYGMFTFFCEKPRYTIIHYIYLKTASMSFLHMNLCRNSSNPNL